jgi:hypothetical protein
VVLLLVSVSQTRSGSQKQPVRFTPPEAEQLWPDSSRTRDLQAGPRIVIQHPQVMDSGTGPVLETTSPTDFLISFEANRAPVDMDSLRITAKKGLFVTSLTDRLRPYIQGTSLQAQAVTLPAGRFQIQIEIADQSGAKTDGHYLLRVQEQ